MPHIPLMAAVKSLGYIGLTSVIFLESGVPFGFFLPGASLLFTAGILASDGLFNIWLLIPLISLAAIIGDSVGYWFGAWVGPSLFSWTKSRWFDPAHLAQAHAFYMRYGPQTIVLARFVPIVRTFVPIVAGVVAMPYQLFLPYNILGGCLFGSGITFAGYYLGRHVPFIGEHITGILLIIVFVTTAPLLMHIRGHTTPGNSSV